MDVVAGDDMSEGMSSVGNLTYCRLQSVYGDRICMTLEVQHIETVRSGEDRKGSIIWLLQWLPYCIMMHKHM